MLKEKFSCGNHSKLFCNHNEITGSGNKDKYGFKRDLKKALEKLIEIEMLEGYDESEFKQGRVTVTKPYKALPKPRME